MPRRTVVINAEEANPAAFAMFCSFVEFCDYLEHGHMSWDSFQSVCVMPL